MTTPPWEPPYAGSEVEQLVGSLERLRATFRYKIDGLDAAGLSARLPSSSLTLGGLAKHLAAQEDYQFRCKLRGEALGPSWEANGWDDDEDWEFTSAADDSPEQLYELYDGAVARSRIALETALAGGGLDQEIAATFGTGQRANLRRLLCDFLEEYGRHTGQADLLREAVDGVVGEDPPPDWRP